MSWRVRVRQREECADQPFLMPDIVIQVADYGVYLDFAIPEAPEPGNKGGLRSREALHTAILIQLFTDARARDNDPLLDDLDPDRRGWWGDTVARVPEQGDYPLGSRLWTLRRHTISRELEQIAEEMVIECLQPIVNQGAVARFDVDCQAGYGRVAIGAGAGVSIPQTGILAIGIRGYAQDGEAVYDQKFEVLWDQVRSLAGAA